MTKKKLGTVNLTEILKNSGCWPEEDEGDEQ